MNTAQRSQHHGESVVGYEGQPEAKQGRLRIPSGVNFRVKVRLKVFEGGFNVIATTHKIRMVRPSRVCILQRTRPPHV